jgi:hypothetical protein
MGIGSAAATPYGNGDQLVSDMIGPAYRIVKLVADRIDDIDFINSNREAIIAAGEIVKANLEVILNSVEASESAALAASNAASSEASIMASIDTVTQAVLDAQAAADRAAQSALEIDNAVTGNYLDKTGGTVNGNVEVTGALTVAQNAYGPGWNTSYAVPTRHDVRGAIEGVKNASVPTSLVGAANGVVPTDSSNKVPVSFLPDAVLGGLRMMGGWDAQNNNPVIPAASAANKGHYLVAFNSGNTTINTSLGPINDWNSGDWIVSDGVNWFKIDNTDRIASVNGKTGVVTLNKADVGLGSVDNTADVNKPVSVPQANALATKAPYDPRYVYDGDNVLLPSFAEDVIACAVSGHLTILNYAGTPKFGWGLVLQLPSDNNTWNILWGSKYRAVGVPALPATTTPNKTMYIGMIFNGFVDKFDVISVIVEP